MSTRVGAACICAPAAVLPVTQSTDRSEPGLCLHTLYCVQVPKGYEHALLARAFVDGLPAGSLRMDVSQHVDLEQYLRAGPTVLPLPGAKCAPCTSLLNACTALNTAAETRTKPLLPLAHKNERLARTQLWIPSYRFTILHMLVTALYSPVTRMPKCCLQCRAGARSRTMVAHLSWGGHLSRLRAPRCR